MLLPLCCYSAIQKKTVPPPDVLFEVGTLLDTPKLTAQWHVMFGACMANSLGGCLGVSAAFRNEVSDTSTYPVFPVFVFYEQCFDIYLRGISANFLLGHNSRGETGQIDSITLFGWRWVNPSYHTSFYVGLGPRLLLFGDTSLSGVISIKLGYSL